MEPLSPTKSPLFHNKHRYQKIGVHEVSACDGRRYNVLYLATGTENRSLGTCPQFAFPSRAGNGREAAETCSVERSEGPCSQLSICLSSRKELPSPKYIQFHCVGKDRLKAEPHHAGFTPLNCFSLWQVSGQTFLGPGRGSTALPRCSFTLLSRNPLQSDPLCHLLSVLALVFQVVCLSLVAPDSRAHPFVCTVLGFVHRHLWRNFLRALCFLICDL